MQPQHWASIDQQHSSEGLDLALLFCFLISSWSQSSSEPLQNTEPELCNLEPYTLDRIPNHLDVKMAPRRLALWTFWEALHAASFALCAEGVNKSSWECHRWCSTLRDGPLPKTLACNYTEPIRLLVRNDSQEGGGVEGEKRKGGWSSLS